MELSNDSMSDIKNPRRGFLKFVSKVLQPRSLGSFKSTFARSFSRNDKGIVVHEDEGKHVIMGRSNAQMTIKISDADHGIESVSFCIEDIVPGRKIPVHKHLSNDEVIFIQGGAGIFTFFVITLLL
jgi:hypothetical protein